MFCHVYLYLTFAAWYQYVVCSTCWINMGSLLLGSWTFNYS